MICYTVACIRIIALNPKKISKVDTYDAGFSTSSNLPILTLYDQDVDVCIRSLSDIPIFLWMLTILIFFSSSKNKDKREKKENIVFLREYVNYLLLVDLELLLVIMSYPMPLS